MTEMRKYMHVERLTEANNPEVAGLLEGVVHIFPKLDGACHSVWYDPERKEVRCSSRNQILSEINDGTGFHAYFTAHPELSRFAEDYKDFVLYGEFLTPHTIKDYEDSAWNEFYAFDMVRYGENGAEYMEYERYSTLLASYGIKSIPSMGWMVDPSFEDVRGYVEQNRYLMKGTAVGEGIVVKNYRFRNQYGRTVWGKLVREDFTHKSRSLNKGERVPAPEERLAMEHVSKEFVSKEFNKFTTDRGEVWNDKLIPDFLRYAWHEWWTDYSFEVVADFNGTLDMRLLRRSVSKMLMRYLRAVS